MKSRIMKSSSMAAIVIACFFMLSSYVWAQEKEEANEEKEKTIQLKSLPAAVQKTIAEQTKGSKILGISKEKDKTQGKTVYEVETKIDKRSRDMLIAEDGVMIELEEEVTLETLPAAVTDTLNRELGGGTVKKIEALSKNGSLSVYEIAIEKNGKKSELSIAPDGSLKR